MAEICNKLGMTLLISLRSIMGKNVPSIELVQGGGSPSNHHSVTKNSSLVGLQHNCDIRLENWAQGNFFPNIEVELDRQGGGLDQGSISKPTTWEKCSIKILIA